MSIASERVPPTESDQATSAAGSRHFDRPLTVKLGSSTPKIRVDKDGSA
jgi:hypothetical protein